MVVLHQYDYIFAIGTIFAFLDAWNIGANDVANSFATSVSSRSLTMKQAMMIASCMEFAGAVAVGARVSETIRTKVIDPSLFDNNPPMLMLGMMCAVIGSSIYLTIATKIGLPVSTTHSIMGGIIGMGFATVGAKNISWGWGGVSTVFAAWGIAPGMSGAFGAIVFLITKYAVMKRSDPVRNAFYTIPAYFFLTASLIAMLVVWKGAAKSIHLNGKIIDGIIVAVGAGVCLLVIIFFLPYLYRRVVCRDWQLTWWDLPKGPLLLKRGEVPPPPPGKENCGIQNYYRGHLTREELDQKRVADQTAAAANPDHDIEKVSDPDVKESKGDVSSDNIVTSPLDVNRAMFNEPEIKVSPRPEGPWHNPKVLFWLFKRWFFRGVEKDVVEMQKKKSILSGDLEEMHARATHFNNDAEFMYSFLQIMTATASSFTHGANDVSNAIGPYATIYLIWSTSNTSKSVPVPTWILVFGGAGIVIGLWTYGYNLMRNLGNRLTLMSPARGFSMELGSCITVIMATRLKLPVSTTQCITGATVGVGLCSGDWRTINWRMVTWIYCGWFITLPVTALISGLLMAIIINAPRW